jgi:hypothetical protein
MGHFSEGDFMDRKVFLTQSIRSLGCCAAVGLLGTRALDAHEDVEQRSADAGETEFIKNWLADLMNVIDRDTDEPTKARLVGACGRACFERFDFKRNWAVEGRGDVEKLVTALQKNFDVWRDGSVVHVRYGATSKGCYCPAARYRPAKQNDLHCYCSRGSHQAVWETALSRPVHVEILESVRRGGKTCHFAVHLDA